MRPEITELLGLIENMRDYQGLIDHISKNISKVDVSVLTAARPYLIAALYRMLNRPIFVITAIPEDSKKLYEMVVTWGDYSEAILFPEPDAMPYQQINPHTVSEIDRMKGLSALARSRNGQGRPLTVTSIPALMQKVMPYGEFTSSCQLLKVGDIADPLILIKRWQEMGYRLEITAELPGTISHRGGIIDIYPPSSELPARLDFFGNAIESIRLFNPFDQRSLQALPELFITPASEVPLASRTEEMLRIIFESVDLSACNQDLRLKFERDSEALNKGRFPDNLLYYVPFIKRESVLNYLSEDTLIVLNEPRNMETLALALETKAEDLRRDKINRGDLPHNLPKTYLNWQEIMTVMDNVQQLSLNSWGSDADKGMSRLDFSPAPCYAGQIPSMIGKLKDLQKLGHRIILVSHQASRLSEILGEADIIAPAQEKISKIPPTSSVTLVSGLMDKGWTMDHQNHLFTDYEIFGFSKEHRVIKQRPASHRSIHGNLNPGDYVVHVEHGIAKFKGARIMESAGAEKEYLVLEYAEGDRLYVPTDQIFRVSRYIGATEKPPMPTRLGTPEWSHAKQKASKAAEEVAEELLSLYAEREVVPGFSFSADTVWQQELESSFPYLETPDQYKVQKEVKDDMTKPKPMDRLVCGDVGYGKTEIAIRAAFKAVMDSKQVAMLVPTTILAQQHFSTFSRRLSAFPLCIEALSRFKNPKEQRGIIEGIASGKIDICIGTHRLLQKDVKFKDLGLLIIDEEQRFGVNHKEFFKQIRKEVDVLTLSATPIPRTLHMALAGVRDMSTIETPPEDRLPIKSYVAEYDETLIREAILRELERGGQTFFVHNRVQSIGTIYERLRNLVPEASIAIAHGQMTESDLESVTKDFANGRIDILLCTTIIESGLDMPNVNTLIVNKADRFGLTQLYQLRGRIGRGTNPAYAYFLHGREGHMTHSAEMRLRTIFEAADLGAGFDIALRDLEIRGAGNLLGMKQSGQINSVGFNLYCRLLAEAVDREKNRRSGKTEQKAPPSSTPLNVDLPIDSYIPQWYISDLNTRLSFYRRLGTISGVDAIEDMRNELIDRFGTLPQETENLLYTVKVKSLATNAGIRSIDTESGQIILRTFPYMPFDKQMLSKMFTEGVQISRFQLRIDYKRSIKWYELLESILIKIHAG